ncbi:MAG TPA: hypothetical protein ENN66_03900, partial [Proteobacteria bacterium]|nr:hypothetical protein [Pseudomonadota bacterium]
MVPYKKLTYLGAITVFVLSVAITITLPISELFKGITAMPAVGALIGALYQLLRDHAAHERQIQLQNKKHSFDLAVTSPMATIAFNKHAEFCEKYMKKIHETLRTLIRGG